MADMETAKDAGKPGIERRHATVLATLYDKADDFVPVAALADGHGQIGRVSGKTLRELRKEMMIEMNMHGEFKITPGGFKALVKYRLSQPICQPIRKKVRVRT